MKELKFRYASAKNLLCFGEEGIELFFDDYGHIIRIQGVNLDNPGTVEGQPSDNGAGKSSVPEILSVGLFGRSIKKPKKLKNESLLNDSTEGDMVIEVQWDDCRVVRTIKRKSKSQKLEFWKSPNHIWDKETAYGKGINETQAKIEDELGFSHHTFCNILVFDDSNEFCFLEADAETKRKMVENILGLGRYREYGDNAKALLKVLKADIAEAAKEYERLQIEMESAEGRLKRAKEQEGTWREKQKVELKGLMTSIKGKQDQLENLDGAEALVAYQKAQEDIEALRNENADIREKRQKIQGLVSEAQGKLEAARTNRNGVNQQIQEHTLRIQTANEDKAKAQKIKNDLGKLEAGTKCPVCHGTIQEENYASVVKHSCNLIEGCDATIKKETDQIAQLTSDFSRRSAFISKAEENIRSGELKIDSLAKKVAANEKKIAELSRIEKPESDAAAKVLETEIIQLKKQFKEKKEEFDGDSPYKEIIADAVREQTEKEGQIKIKAADIETLEAEVPYHEFWVKSFGDKGIRKYIIDGIVPALNSRIAYWLHYLIDGKIELTFDNELEATVKRTGRNTEYHGLSKSEKRRVNLAVSQAFAYVMMLNSGCCPSLVFLDEITGGSIDRAGISGVCSMVMELAKERQVFITTHDENLLSMIQGCETIQLQKQDDVTTLIDG